MITKNEIKFIRSLKIKKNRIKSNQFVVEGEKMVDELIESSIELVKVYSTSSKYEYLNDLYCNISKTNLSQISNLKTPNKVTAVIVKPPYVAYVKPTGIIFIAFDKQKIHATIEIVQKIAGPKFVNPLVDFKKPLEVIPKIIANNKKIYPDKFVIDLTCFAKQVDH